MSLLDICRINSHKSLMQNSLWNHDAYPELPDLLPHERIVLGEFTGPGIVKTIHLTLNIEDNNREELLRGVFLEATYNDKKYPSVLAPVGDFFCDSFGGRSTPFAGMMMAKRPINSLYCYFPMPFRQQMTLSLVNTTAQKVTGYGYVTAEQIPEWDAALGYFHAKWINQIVKLPGDIVPLLNTQGSGHLVGCHLTAVSACRHFLENQGICEGNDEFYIDGSTEPNCNYLGTEDFFGFSWNWRHLWYDDYSGTTYLSDDDGVTRLACYRFLLNDPIRFSRSLLAQINYRHEINNTPLNSAKAENNGDVEFGVVVYWYQSEPVAAAGV